MVSSLQGISGTNGIIVNMTRATALLLSFERQGNLKKIIKSLREQTAPIKIFLWNNCLDDHVDYGVDLQINSSKNLMCWPRWFMANYATTDYVFSLDDDLLFADNRIIEDAIYYLDKSCCDAIGYSGVKIIDGHKDYLDQQHILFPRQDESVDILKGGFLFAKRKNIRIPQNLFNVDAHNPRIEDDIVISSFLSHKIVPRIFRKRLRRQAGFFNGLHSKPDHAESRTQYMRQYYE